MRLFCYAMENSYNKSVGAWGEGLASGYLCERGYRMVDSNVKTSYKETDLICWHEDVLVFVEVKTRIGARYGEAVEMINDKKIRNMKQAARVYLLSNKLKFRSIRLDFIAIDVNRESGVAKIRHYKDIA